MQRSLEAVHVGEPVGRYVVAIADATRQDSAAPGRRQPARHARAW